MQRVHATVLRVLQTRGYASISADASTCATPGAPLPPNHLSLARSMLAERPVLYGRRGERAGRRLRDIRVYFHIDAKVGIKWLRKTMEATEEEEEACADEAASEEAASSPLYFIVSLEGPTSFTRREVNRCDVQFFTYKSLMNDITQHAMVPRHRLLSLEEADTAAKRYNVRHPKEWPCILLKDPLCLYHDFREGDLVEICRTDLIAQEPTLYYRRVVA